MKKRLLVMALLTGVLAQAEEIRLDFNTWDDPGGNWNVAQNPLDGGMTDLTDYSTGSATTINVAWDFDNQYGIASAWTGGEKDWVNDAVGDDFLYAIGDATVSFSGLSESAYQVEVLISYVSGSGLNTRYRIGGAAADRTYNGTPVSDPWNWQIDGTVGQNWMIWDDVAPAAGSFNIDLSADFGGFSGISAVRISPVPEPATLGLIAISAALLLGLRRIRNYGF